MSRARVVRVVLASVVVWCVVGVGAAFAAPGDLDISFGGGDGFVMTSFSSNDDEAYGVVVDSEGRIVVAGASNHADDRRWDFAVGRYTTDGVLDTSFGAGGKVVTRIGNERDYGQAVAVDSQDRIVVAGSTRGGSVNDWSEFAVARYTVDGVLDTDFGGGDGIVTTGSSSSTATSRWRLWLIRRTGSSSWAKTRPAGPPMRTTSWLFGTHQRACWTRVSVAVTGS